MELTEFIKNGDLQKVKQLVNAGNYSDSRHVEGHLRLSSLVYAALYNQAAVAEYFITECGAKVDEKDGPDGSTPLMFAAQRGSTEAMQVLFDNGANVNAVNSKFYAAYNYAIVAGQKKSVEKLLELGANSKQLNKLISLPTEGSNKSFGYAVDQAIYSQKLDIMELLIKHQGIDSGISFALSNGKMSAFDALLALCANDPKIKASMQKDIKEAIEITVENGDLNSRKKLDALEVRENKEVIHGGGNPLIRSAAYAARKQGGHVAMLGKRGREEIKGGGLEPPQAGIKLGGTGFGRNG